VQEEYLLPGGLGAAIGGKYDVHDYTQTENIKQFRVAYSECNFTVFVGVVIIM
jgi:hypothetical protein